MRMRSYVGVALVVAALMLLGAGCAKKQVESERVEPTQVERPADTGVETRGPTGTDLDAERAAKEAETRAMLQAKDALITEKIYFDFDKSALKPEAKDTLQDKADILKTYASWNLLIEGHCDERGTEEYNLALGERRARTAYEYLVLLGVSPRRMKIVSFGEERPAVLGSNESAWAKNRRAEFKVFE